MKAFGRLFVAGLAVVSAVSAWSAGLRLDELGITMRSPREYSFSDKSAGFYYGMTGVDDWKDGNAGWNIRAKHVFRDYSLYADGDLLSKVSATTRIYPYKLERDFGETAQERFYLFDDKKVIYIDLSAPGHKTIGLRLYGDNLTDAKVEDGTVVYNSEQTPGCVVRVASADGSGQVSINDGVASAPSSAGGFIITFGERKESLDLVSECRSDRDAWIADRMERMQSIVDANSISPNVDRLAEALAWIELTADELVTRQHGGWGIYAGFPWFTDFWGRDMFISMPGTVLCTGEFAVARDILESFAKYQDLDAASPTYGRVPNRLNLDGILYNTTDGTPRFVMQVADYLRYTGDKDFIKRIYRSVKIATDASIKLYADSCGYLTHADADTWMDAKRQGEYPCSPRGNRAVDIQALWYGQLISAAELADNTGNSGDARRWREMADKLKHNFERDFTDGRNIFDHLNADGSPDGQLRPNTMFAYELLPGRDSLTMGDMRRIWERLVYPWGVSSLDQMDDQFHPYHEQWHRYHKDDAYHNGTVWLWLNGMAMQRMIEYGQVDQAYKLFANMNRQALAQGAAGSLSECADAWCRPGKTWAGRSGTFLQAWSNAEQIRVWSQCFLGVRPDMLSGQIHISPSLPSKMKQLSTTMKLGDGRLDYTYRKLDGKGERYYCFEWSGSREVDVVVDLDCFETVKLRLPSGGSIELTTTGGGKLMAKAKAADGKVMDNRVCGLDDSKTAFAEKSAAVFDGVKFAKPCYREDLKSMSRYFNPPLDYYSVE